ncbi:MAG: Crp/Fnr family transcriptional regulator [Bdellovibrionota bacterium]
MLPMHVSSCSEKKNPHCQTCESRHQNIVFSPLDQDAFTVLDKAKSVHHYKKGQYVFHVGSAPNGLYCVNSGVILLESETRSGTARIHRMVSGGGVLGYRALFAGESYSASALVNEDATICHIPRVAIFDLIRNYPELSFKLLSHVSKELRQAELRHKNLSDKDAPSRVAETILQLDKVYPGKKWTRKEVAEWADTTPETVMRSFATFKKQGLIDIDGRKVTVKNYDALLDLADPLD